MENKLKTGGSKMNERRLYEFKRLLKTNYKYDELQGLKNLYSIWTLFQDKEDLDFIIKYRDLIDVCMRVNELTDYNRLGLKREAQIREDLKEITKDNKRVEELFKIAYEIGNNKDVDLTTLNYLDNDWEWGYEDIEGGYNLLQK